MAINGGFYNGFSCPLVNKYPAVF